MINLGSVILNKSKKNNFQILKYYHITKLQQLNRILFDLQECSFDSNQQSLLSSPSFSSIIVQDNNHQNQNIIASIPLNDYRSKHILEVLKLTKGENLRVGIINKGITDIAFISDINEKIYINIGLMKDLIIPKKPKIDLILGIPRPQRIEQIISSITCLGVNRLYLVKTSKLEKYYMGSPVLNKPTLLRETLISGLMQSSVDCWLPECNIYKNMKEFHENFHDKILPNCNNNENNNNNHENILKIICHPSKSFITTNNSDSTTYTNYRQRKRIDEMRSYKDDVYINNQILTPYINNLPIPELPDLSTIYSTSQLFPQLITNLKLNSNNNNNQKIDRIVVAIGPDGGWSDGELHYFHFNKFNFIHLGNRVLRTDLAISGVLTLVNQWIDSLDETNNSTHNL